MNGRAGEVHVNGEDVPRRPEQRPKVEEKGGNPVLDLSSLIRPEGGTGDWVAARRVILPRCSPLMQLVDGQSHEPVTRYAPFKVISSDSSGRHGRNSSSSRG